MKRLLITLLFLFPLFSFGESNFKYEDSENSGMGKVERIGKIENFLSRLGRKMDTFKTGLDKEFGESLEQIKKDLKKIEEEDLKNLNQKINKITKTEIENLKESFKKFQKDDVATLKKKVDSQDKTIKKLEKEIQSLNLTLKSLTNSKKP